MFSQWRCAAASLLLVPGLTVVLTTDASASLCTIVAGRADSSCTPGAFNPDVTQSTIRSTICVSGWTATIRPPSSYTTNLKNEQKIDYGEASIPNSELEEDHLVPLELGGAPRDPGNLWPQPFTGPLNARNKDVVENYLHDQVCSAARPLADAQRQEATDWVAVYRQLRPLAWLAPLLDPPSAW